MQKCAILQVARKKEIAAMPTIEEELRALKGALSVMESRHLSDVQQLREQVNVLQRQLGEQQRQVSGQGQSMQQLEKALVYQFNAINARFDEQTSAIRAQFENTNMQLGRVVGLVDFQEKDIREIKADVGIIRERVDSIDQRLDGVDQRMESGFATQGQMLNQILERLPKQQ